jgi:hypothetical protein
VTLTTFHHLGEPGTTNQNQNCTRRRYYYLCIICIAQHQDERCTVWYSKREHPRFASLFTVSLVNHNKLFLFTVLLKKIMIFFTHQARMKSINQNSSLLHFFYVRFNKNGKYMKQATPR